MASLRINEFLCFLSVQFNKMTRDNLISVLLDSYGYLAASEAKTVLIAECKNVSICDSIAEFTIKRIKGKSGSLNRVITDAVDIWTVVDRERKGELAVTFVAADPNQLPAANADKFSLQFLVAAIAKLQEKVEAQDSILNYVKDKLDSSLSVEFQA